MQTPTETFQISGIVPVLPAPFTPDEQLDLDSLRSVVRFCVDADFPAVCLPAYGSEFYKLTMEERFQMVATAVESANGCIPVIGQSNHVSSKLAAEIAKKNEEFGAGGISVAIPRLFPLSDDDIFHFLGKVMDATSLPVLVQDFNPGGATVSPAFVKRIHEEYPQFRWLKLEEPLMGQKVEQILEHTGGAVQVLEGWGGMYLLEGISSGICGAMPGVGIADLLQETFQRGKAGDMEGAMDLFEEVLPHIVFSLQNLELFLHMEKQLLLKRNLIAHATVRSATLAPDPGTGKHVEFLTARILQSVGKLTKARSTSSRDSLGTA